jgi:pyruvate kinase
MRTDLRQSTSDYRFFKTVMGSYPSPPSGAGVYFENKITRFVVFESKWPNARGSRAPVGLAGRADVVSNKHVRIDKTNHVSLGDFCMARHATKIVATLGPASSDPPLLEKMIRAGVNVVRLNFSHGKAQDHIDRAKLVREAAQRAGREVAIMADLQGPKIRVGKFAEGKVMLENGAKFVLDASRTELGDIHGVGLDYKELPRDVKPGDLLLLNDGLIVLTVEAVRGEQVHTIVKVGGELSNNKGINKQGGGLTAPALTGKDMEDIKTAMSFQADYVAVSFPKNATDMEMARQLANVAGAEYKHKPGLIAKIERAEAIPLLEEILRASDGIMVARGDLAVEVGNAAVPALQKRMIKLAREHDKVVITATQMMESMITNPVPTRAEVSDVANAVLDGTDAVMLSAETAAGKYPLETVEEMSKICAAAEGAEEVELDGDFRGQTFTRIDQTIAMGALFTAHHLGAKAIVALTESGSTALWMSRHRIHIPIYAVTTKVTSQRKMALFRNVRPLLMDTSADRDTALAQAEAHLKLRGIVDTGDVYAITCGDPMGTPGGTNMLRICEVR